MSLFVASLNSGSNGNCYYVGNATEAVLIDAGISCRETEKRLKRLGLDIRHVKAIFITHEHIDHIKGLQVLATKHQLPVYITPLTWQESKLPLPADLVHTFQADSPIRLGGLAITAFSKWHDAVDPHSCVISCGNVNVGVFTDIGGVCPNLIRHFKTCHAVFLESNYDEEMLENGRYPYALKRRIRGGKGHISNKQALELFCQHRPSYMSHVFLSHLSQENNHPDLARNLFLPHAGSMEIIVASRFQESALYTIQESFDQISPTFVNTNVYSPSVRRKTGKVKNVPDPFQLSLF
jgi:phosphoribosyl 1,2-cyclic phosphodiesterase